MTKRKNPAFSQQGQGGGRPKIILTELQVKQIKLLAEFMWIGDIARIMGFSQRTFHNIIQRDPKAMQAYRYGKAKVIGLIAKSLIEKAMNGDTTSQIFYLKTQAGWRECNATTKEPDATKPIQFESEYLQRIKAELASRN